MYKKVLTAISLSAMLVSCATPTPYQPEGSQGGFSEMALNHNTYTVSFRGNGSTSAQLVNNYLLRRGAELTANSGYKYFVKLDGDTQKNTSVVTTPTTISTYDNKDKERHTKDTTTVVNPGSTYEVNSYTSRMTIRMLNDNKKFPDAFKAKTILSNFPDPNKVG